jgi:hypothetical protein
MSRMATWQYVSMQAVTVYDMLLPRRRLDWNTGRDDYSLEEWQARYGP